MNILAVGDVVGTSGCRYLREHLFSIKKLYNVDMCIVNGENSADSNGITPETAEDIFTSGADVITTGNHVFRRREIYDYLDESPYIIRPANYPAGAPGKGYCIVDFGRTRVCVINVMGTLYMDALENPFTTVDKIVAEVGKMITVVDFHAEATSEKRALGYYLDGKVSAVLGTHTHVQTADEQILPNGTAYITDLGMTGPAQSVLGAEVKVAIDKFITKMPARFRPADGNSALCGTILQIDDKNCLATVIKRIHLE